MRVVLRVDASVEIGTGHVRRCLTLADTLRSSGAECSFICRKQPGDSIRLILESGYAVSALDSSGQVALTQSQQGTELGHARWLPVSQEVDAEQTRLAIGPVPVDLLVVDHYSLDWRWEAKLRPVCQRILVIDDLADRRHDCDLLLDQNISSREGDYSKLTPAHCKLMIGGKYALLREEFSRRRFQVLSDRMRRGRIARILVSMGGVDEHNATGSVLDALARHDLPDCIGITVVLGSSAPSLDTVRAQAAKMPVSTQVLVDVSDMADKIASSDLAIGAAGGSAWERCCLGLPTLVCILADNQVSVAEALRGMGAAVVLPSSNLARALHEALARLYGDYLLVRDMSSSAARIIDGLGAQRVKAEICHGLQRG